MNSGIAAGLFSYPYGETAYRRWTAFSLHYILRMCHTRFLCVERVGKHYLKNPGKITFVWCFNKEWVSSIKWDTKGARACYCLVKGKRAWEEMWHIYTL